MNTPVLVPGGGRWHVPRMSPEPDAQLLFDAGDHDRPILRLLRRYGTDHRSLVVLGAFAALVSPVAALLPIYLVETVIDGILLDAGSFSLPLVPQTWLPHDALSQLLVVATLMVALALVAASSAWVGAWTWGRFAQHVQHDVRTDAFRQAQRLGLAFFDDQQTGQLVSILNDDVNQLNQLLETFLARAIEITARFAAIVCLLFLLHWQLALLLCLLLPVLAGTARVFVRRLKPRYRAVRQRVGALNARIQNTLANVATIKAYTREPEELDRIRASSRNVFAQRWQVIQIRAKFFPAMTAINWIGFGALLVIGGYWILVGPPLGFDRPLQVGTLVSFMLFGQQFTTPLVQAAHLVDDYYDSRASVARIFALTERRVDIEPAPDPFEFENVTGHIAIEDVSFGFTEGETVLKYISLEIEPGEFLGIVGPSGSGKTTLSQLLLRFYEPDGGRIRLDGRDVRAASIRSLRHQFALVSQEPSIFTGTVRENIAFGNPDAGDGDIREAATLARADTFIDELPAGYETPVGERGVKLSGGQRQRLALARAIVADAPILVLDEALSHVDVETEAAIRASIARTVEARTTIAIAHRLSTVRHADRIVVIKDGTIAETGTHEELLAADGVYARLWNLQVGASADIGSAMA